MREIKFRAKGIHDDKWRYGYLSGLNGDICFIRASLWSLDCYSETLGQYTGLKDKNGVEIYEGDILKGTFYGFPLPEINCVFTVCWNEEICGFQVNAFKANECEVIGNIYENKELLEEEK